MKFGLYFQDIYAPTGNKNHLGIIHEQNHTFLCIKCKLFNFIFTAMKEEKRQGCCLDTLGRQLETLGLTSIVQWCL